MPAKKISRKKLLKEPDEFISTTGKVLQYLRGHKRQLTIYGIVVLTFIAAGGLGYSYFRWQEEKARAVQQQGLQLYQEAIGRAGDEEKGKEGLGKALEKFQEARKKYSRGNTGQVSQILIGHCYYALKEYDPAIQAYLLVQEGPFRAAALQSLGYCYEAKGEPARALEYFQKNAEGEPSPYQETALLAVARCYEALKQNPQALEAYRKALARNPKSQMAEFIQRKVSELKG